MIEQEPTTPDDVEEEDSTTSSDEQAESAEKSSEESVVVEEASDEEDYDLDPEALREEVKELRARAKNAGLHPLRRMLRDYIDNAIDAADSLLGALEGSSRKKGK